MNRKQLNLSLGDSLAEFKNYISCLPKRVRKPAIAKNLPKPVYGPRITVQKDTKKNVTIYVRGVSKEKKEKARNRSIDTINLWGAVIVYGQHIKEMSNIEQTYKTSIALSLKALIEGLKALTRPCHVTIVTSCMYIPNMVKKNLEEWAKNGWDPRKGAQHIYSNHDYRPLWMELHRLLYVHEVKWVRSITLRDDPICSNHLRILDKIIKEAT